jgi:putative DeoR family transcriptional regulator (stage III sporulation protein D)
MKEHIWDRVITLANYALANKATVRATAKKFGVSKSTVHKDFVDRLPEINPGLAAEIKKLLDVNKQERHIRGGYATKKKYMNA